MITLEEYRKFLVNNNKQDNTRAGIVLTPEGWIFVDDLRFIESSISEIDKDRIFDIKWKPGKVSEQIDINRAIKRHKKILSGLKRLHSLIYGVYFLEDPSRNPTTEKWAAVVERYIKKVYHILSAIVLEAPEVSEKMSPSDLKLIREYHENPRNGFMNFRFYENPKTNIDKFTLENDNDSLMTFLETNKDKLDSIMSYRKSNWGGDSVTWLMSSKKDSEFRTSHSDSSYGIIGNLREIMKSTVRDDPDFIDWLQKVTIDYTPEDLRNLIVLAGIVTEEEAPGVDGIDALDLVWKNEDKIWDSLFYGNILYSPVRPIRTFISCVYFKK